ncbi:MAG: hypothetical protein AAF495_28520 [Pseudomonadota bacterium]
MSVRVMAQAPGRDDNLMAAARLCLERVEVEIETHPDTAGTLAFGSAVLGCKLKNLVPKSA